MLSIGEMGGHKSARYFLTVAAGVTIKFNCLSIDYGMMAGLVIVKKEDIAQTECTLD